MSDARDTLRRRRFLTRMVALGLLSRSALALAAEPAPPPAADWAAQAPWTTLRAVLAHLLPHSDDAPGADDIHAIGYLHDTLENPAADADAKARVVEGAARIEALAQAQQQQPFAALGAEPREALLREFEGQRGGSAWLSSLLTFLMEALLADPVYGGNTDQAGWRWLGHQPGFPRPPADKTWFRLAPSVQRRSKAT